MERELDEELAFHIDRETEKHVQSGLAFEETRLVARSERAMLRTRNAWVKPIGSTFAWLSLR